MSVDSVHTLCICDKVHLYFSSVQVEVSVHFYA